MRGHHRYMYTVQVATIHSRSAFKKHTQRGSHVLAEDFFRLVFGVEAAARLHDAHRVLSTQHA